MFIRKNLACKFLRFLMQARKKVLALISLSMLHTKATRTKLDFSSKDYCQKL